MSAESCHSFMILLVIGFFHRRRGNFDKPLVTLFLQHYFCQSRNCRAAGSIQVDGSSVGYTGHIRITTNTSSGAIIIICADSDVLTIPGHGD